MAMLKGLTFALAILCAAGHGHEHAEPAEVVAEAHGEAAVAEAVEHAEVHEAEAAVDEAVTEAVEVTEKNVTTLEAEVAHLKAELKALKSKESEEVEGSALVLLYSVSLVALIIYLVNSTRAVVRRQTWNLVSTAISIFVAVMLNTLIKESFTAMGAQGDTVGNEFLYLIFWWITAVIFLYIYRDSALRLLGYGTIYGHILGFAAIDAYGALAGVEVFHENPWMTVVVIVIYMVSIPVILAPTALLGKCFKHEALHEQCKETSIDFFSMGLSFLIAMFFRGVIKFERTGVAAGAHAVGIGSTLQERTLLWAVGTAFLIVGLFLHLLNKTCKSAQAPMLSEIVHIFGTVAAMTAAWCWLDAMTWLALKEVAPDHGHGHHRRLHGHEGEPVAGVAEPAEESLGVFHWPTGVFTAKLFVAAFFTLVFVLAVYLTACVTRYGGVESKRIVKGTMTAVSLVVGLGWEHLFDTAIDEVAEMATTKKGEQWLKVAISLFLVLMVLPAWMVYILPKHNAELIEKYQGQSLSCLAACGDCCDELDDEESGEYEYAEDEDDNE